MYVCDDDASMDDASMDDARRLSFTSALVYVVYVSLVFVHVSREKSVVRMWLKLQRARY